MSKIKRREVYADESTENKENYDDKLKRLISESESLVQKRKLSKFFKRTSKYFQGNDRSRLLQKVGQDEDIFDKIMNSDAFSEEEKTFILFSVNKAHYNVVDFDDEFEESQRILEDA